LILVFLCATACCTATAARAKPHCFDEKIHYLSKQRYLQHRTSTHLVKNLLLRCAIASISNSLHQMHFVLG
jgi:hypothetical protein